VGREGPSERRERESGERGAPAARPYHVGHGDAMAVMAERTAGQALSAR
jgi:hypothetical protein